MSKPTTVSHRKARRVIRRVARIMRSIGDTALGTKYQQLSRRLRA